MNYQSNMLTKKGRRHNRQFGKMAGLVLNSSSVLRLNFSAKLNICTSISATSPSCKNVVRQCKKPTLGQAHLVFANTQSQR
jgi:hypothetical protein